MQDEILVFLDLETGGLEHTRPIIQIAAISVSSESLRERESIELKVQFDKRLAHPNALSKNSYSDLLWESEAIEPTAAARQLSAFLRRHATFDVIAHDGNTYRLAQLVAHNASFDGPFIQAWYRRLGQYCPARYQVLCTLQRAIWWFGENRFETPPTNFKLQTLCEYFGVILKDENAHDAMADVRATLELYRALRQPAQQSRTKRFSSEELYMDNRCSA